MSSLKLLVFTQGTYGQRILENVSNYAPVEWRIHHVSLPDALPPIIENAHDLVEFLDVVGEWDIILFLGESPSAFSILPAILERAHADSVIAPVDSYNWLPLGLERQIRSELEDRGVNVVFPRTFCTLTPIGVRAIDEFAKIFGSPQLKIVEKNGVISTIRVVRGAPCGSTRYLAEKLPGTKVEDAAERAGLLVQTFPCLASRKVDRFFSDAPIHVAGRIAQKTVEKALVENFKE